MESIKPVTYEKNQQQMQQLIIMYMEHVDRILDLLPFFKQVYNGEILLIDDEVDTFPDCTAIPNIYKHKDIGEVRLNAEEVKTVKELCVILSGYNTKLLANNSTIKVYANGANKALDNNYPFLVYYNITGQFLTGTS